MALYEELARVDVISPVINLLKSGKFAMDWDGKIKPEERVPFDRYWITNVFCPDRKCHLWAPIYFNKYRIIPKGCRSCWKVVLNPKTLRELFDVMNIQNNMKIPAKTGLELRPYTGNVGGYGAYWYAPLADGLEGGRKMFKKLSEKFDRKDLILKRGCTEMELKYYPSSIWDDFREGWDLKEALLDATYECVKERPTKEPGAYITYTMMQWIEWAFEHGDQTYRDYTDQDFKLAYELYHHGGHHTNKFKIEDFRSQYEPDSDGHKCGTGQEDSGHRDVGGPESPVIQTIP